MPKVFRAMKRATDGFPVVGSQSKELGVREPPDIHADVDVDVDSHVALNGRGMSVAENWRDLLPHLIPKRLKEQKLSSDASGSNSLSCWTMGSGLFAAGAMNDALSLSLKQENRRAGNIVPAASMLLHEFQGHLASTREQWAVDET